MEWQSLLIWPIPLILAAAFVVGACIGSFLTLITYRLPRDEPVGATRSRCTSCLKHLRVCDLVPIFSWVSSSGKCRQCKTRISMRYPLTELACALGTVVIVLYYGVTWEAFAIAGLWWGVVAIFVTDLEHYIILDEVQIALALFGICYGVLNDTEATDMLSSAFAGALIGLALRYGYLYFRNKDGLGMGDVKFLAVAGIWLGDGASFIPFLFFSGILGIISGIGWNAFGHGKRFPFGPALATSLLICVVVPQSAHGFWKLYGMLP